jgi:hypothetical protein
MLCQHAIANENHWEPLVKVMGEKFAWLLTDPRTTNLENRFSNPQFVHTTIDEWVMSLDSVKEAERLLDEAGVPCARAFRSRNSRIPIRRSGHGDDAACGATLYRPRENVRKPLKFFRNAVVHPGAFTVNGRT